MWLNPLIFLLTLLHVPYLVASHLAARASDWLGTSSASSFAPANKANYPAPVVHDYPKYLLWLFFGFRQPVYLACIIYYSVTFWLQALFRPHKVCEVKHLSDKELCEVIENSAFINAFTKHSADDGSGDNLYVLSPPEIADFAAHALPGCHIASTTMQFRRTSAHSPLRLDWIEVNGNRFFPSKTDLSWRWAKFHAMHSIKLWTCYFFHSKIHFQQDVYNGLARTLLPQNHALLQLLSPHLDNELEINDMVLNGNMSIIRSESWYIPYNTLPMTRDGLLELMDKHIRQRAEFRIHKLTFDQDFVYGRWCQAYYDVVYAYVEKVVAQVPPKDFHMTRLAHSLSQFIPNFPAELYGDYTPLINMTANYIFGSSFWHTGDHYNVGDLSGTTSWVHKCRVPPPVPGVATPDYSSNDVCTMVDWYKQYVADWTIIVFTPTPLRDTSVLGSVYPYGSNKLLHQYAADFKAALQSTEKELSLAGDNVVPLSEILRSIEF